VGAQAKGGAAARPGCQNGVERGFAPVSALKIRSVFQRGIFGAESLIFGARESAFITG